MAVYTLLGAEALAAIMAEFDVGALVSAKGIAEGVSNSNWLVETAGRDGVPARFILTMYEERTDTRELPFFLGLLDHLAAKACPVPRTIHDRANAAFRWHEGKAQRPAAAVTTATASPDVLADLQDRLLLSIANEAVACLREGVVSEAQLVDAGIIFGAGYAPFRGGPLQDAKRRGIAECVARLNELAGRYGPRFTPDAGWDLLR